eukprot:Seg3858.3 transcript_id=Seg3858.3/GoldUCD/mRNA.D3Y31 product="O-acetyl-ADP-ribose deacetylase MACROD2" protein_id=Seg3858.3/GoldUCD/D3Y31
MKRSLTMDKKEQKLNKLAKLCGLKKSHTLPARTEHDESQKLRAVNHGNPHENEFGRKYLDMPLEQKRKLYSCRSNYEKLEDLVLWPAIWKVQRKHLKFNGPVPKSQKIYPINEELNKKIVLQQGDITRLEIDAIVNAANGSLLGGGGVDGAIHNAAGPSLYDECLPLNGCNTGDSKITSGHRLPAKYIIHTVGPVGRQEKLLESCYKTSLELAYKFKIRSVAFPCISTGIYGYPSKDAVHVALNTVRQWLEVKEHAEQIDRIIFCVYLNKDWNYYADYLQFYFPCEEVKQQGDPATTSKTKDPTTSKEKDTATSKEDTKEDNDGETEAQTELEAEVKNTDNIPSANLDDVIALVEEDKKVAEAAKVTEDTEASAEEPKETAKTEDKEIELTPEGIAQQSHQIDPSTNVEKVENADVTDEKGTGEPRVESEEGGNKEKNGDGQKENTEKEGQPVKNDETETEIKEDQADQEGQTEQKNEPEKNVQEGTNEGQHKTEPEPDSKL